MRAEEMAMVSAGLVSADEILAHAREVVGPALRASVGELPGPIRLMAGYQFG